jgi:hypothetical protein
MRRSLSLPGTSAPGITGNQQISNSTNLLLFKMIKGKFLGLKHKLETLLNTTGFLNIFIIVAIKQN